MLRCTLLLTGVAVFLFINVANSQGCSDAGFCTMGALKPDQPFNRKMALRLRTMEISFYRGTTNLSPTIFVATADMNFSLTEKTSFQVKLPFQMVDGSMAKTSGPGDISLCFTRTLTRNNQFDINFSAGAKIPTNGSDKTEQDMPLPMYYQTSLGTYDFITGISLISRRWLFATGIQHPFNQNNNQFLWGKWENSGHSSDYIKKYAPANKLKRGTDVMVRVERNFRFSRVNFSLGLLPIYRINNDEFENSEGVRIKPDGAKGLAMSGIITTGYQFNVRSGIKLLYGRKIVQRDFNPDGLTREEVTTLSYFYRF
jgi:hypothetical protein